MAVLSLPLSFNNSFWTQDYRKGLEVLFAKLEQGIVENEEVIGFVRARARAEANLAASLAYPAPRNITGGFDADDGASLLMAFRGLQAESRSQGEAHRAVAKELDTLVADPFEDWAEGYKGRVKQSRATLLDNWLRSYEQAQNEVHKLKQTYLTKTRRADEAEDDAKFAPNADLAPDAYTSPRIRPRDARSPPQRTASVSERIAARLREIQKKSAGALSAATSGGGGQVSEVHFDADAADEKGKRDSHDTIVPDAPPPVDKGKGKAIEGLGIGHPPSPPALMESPPPMSPQLPPTINTEDRPLEPPPILLAGLAMPPSVVSTLMKRAAAELPLRSIRVPLLGEYQDCFSGEEFAAWLNANVPGFGGNLDRAEDAARDLTEREGLLRRIGEFGNTFELSDEAFFQFRPKAFDIEGKSHEPSSITSPRVADNLIKRSSTFVNIVSKAIANANAPSEPAHIRARREAEEADQVYRVAVRRLDRQRLGIEERIEEGLKTLQRWELERLRALKTVLLQYQGTLANLPKGLEASNERTTTLLAGYNADNDLTALIERYRTGPFRPEAQVYESAAHDESDVLFGIDLRKWFPVDPGPNKDAKKEEIPAVVTTLLDGLTQAYGNLPSDAEKRKAWIYEVPLPAVHHLREALNAVPPEEPITVDVVTKYDAPVLAATLKLWLLELDPPVVLYEGWDDIRRLYPTVGSKPKAEDDLSEEQHLQDVSSALQKLPRIHLYVLDAVLKHLKTLIDSTTIDEPADVYITKLALSVGRTIVRPRHESEIAIQDRHPTLLFMDLLKHYDAILPPTIARKKRESERKVPIRKRTAPVDLRMSRSKITAGADHREHLAAAASKKVDPPPVPALPPSTAVPPSAPPKDAVTPAAPAPAAVPPPPPLAPIAPAIEPRKAAEVDKEPQPPRPSFKEPPPEDDDLPPRPTFKEPPPELDDVPPPPPMPKFAEAASSPPSSPASGEQKINVIPATPQNQSKVAARRQSYQSSLSGSRQGSPSRITSRSPSPPGASLKRSGSGQTPVRGPRISRGPRAPGGAGSVSGIVSTLNRGSSPSSPNYKRLSGSPGRRAGPGADVLQRRTMASDAEDELVGK